MTDCQLCEWTQHGDDAGRYLCPSCTRATDERLAALPDLYAALSHFLAPGNPAPGPRSSNGHSRARMPVSEGVLDLRGPGGLVALAESWRSALHSDLGWTEPRLLGSYEDRLSRAVKGLRDNLLFVASSWPPAGAFAEEIRDAVDAARSIVDPVDPRDRGRRLGNCPALVDGVLCGAALRAYPGEPHVTCRWCGCSWGPETWLSLKSWIDEDAKEAS